MPSRRIHVAGVPDALVEGVESLRAQLDVPSGFPADVVADAVASAAKPLPAWKDMTDVAFVTIDPAGSMDLDQALHIERDGDGYTVRYAIAAVGFWVTPGGPMDVESQRRGQTFYSPHERAGLYPPELSEGTASLLPEPTPRPAYVWTMRVDADGANPTATVERALVRSRERLDYVGVQQALDDGTASEVLVLLKEVGLLREAQERARGGVSLPIPEQEVVAHDGSWDVVFRSTLPVEGWNAQISLMTGMAAARMMIEAKTGILRTLPPADEAGLGRLRRVAKGLGLDWPSGQSYADFLATLDGTHPRHLAMLQQCTTLFRGASYVAFHGALPEGDYRHNALAAYYAHTTAPLRRLVDRYVLETCACLCAGEPVPDWVLHAYDRVPAIMADSDKRSKQYERGIANLVEALLLTGREGQILTGTVIDGSDDKRRGKVMIAAPAVEAEVRGDAPLGESVTVRVEHVDVVKGKLELSVVS